MPKTLKSYRNYKERYPTKCTHLCPSCKRVCELFDEHAGAHRCGFHEWVHMFKNRLTICLFINGIEENKNG